MNNKIALASAFVAASSLATAEIVINDFLSFEGFIDMGYTHSDGEIDPSVSDGGFDLDVPDFNDSDNTFEINQVEINWLFDFEPVTAQIDIEFEEGDDDEASIEQAFATYSFENGHAITAGRFASMLGFEAFEPTGLYQYSFAYGLPNIVSSNLGDVIGALPVDLGSDTLSAVTSTIFPLPGYYQGVKYTFDNEEFFFGASVQDGTYNYSDRIGGSDNGDDDGGWGTEFAGAWNVTDQLTWFAGFAYEEGDGLRDTDGGTGFGTGDTQGYVFNTYVTYEMGAWFFAAEFFYGENEWDDGGAIDPGLGLLPVVDIETESLGGLIMANYAYSEKASVTGRVSYTDYQLDLDGVDALSGASGEIEADYLKFTLAHNYAFTDNLMLVTEVSYTEGDADLDQNLDEDISAEADYEELFGAIRLLFVF